MEKISVDFDPFTGTRTTTSVTEDEKMIIRSEADIGPTIEYTNALRNADQYSRDGIKRNFWHVATIPDVVIVELKGQGIDVFTASAREIVAGIKKLGKEYLLTTRKQI